MTKVLARYYKGNLTSQLPFTLGRNKITKHSTTYNNPKFKSWTDWLWYSYQQCVYVFQKFTFMMRIIIVGTTIWTLNLKLSINQAWLCSNKKKKVVSRKILKCAYSKVILEYMTHKNDTSIKPGILECCETYSLNGKFLSMHMNMDKVANLKLTRILYLHVTKNTKYCWNFS